MKPTAKTNRPERSLNSQPWPIVVRCFKDVYYPSVSINVISVFSKRYSDGVHPAIC
jgi:hypothetical protein